MKQYLNKMPIKITKLKIYQFCSPTTAVGLSSWLCSDFIIKKDIVNSTQKTIDNLRFLIREGTREIPKDDCKKLLNKAGVLVEANLIEDPYYKVTSDKLD